MSLCCARKLFHLDDALDVWGVHGMGGFIGTVLLGALADPSECADGDAAPSWYTGRGNFDLNPGRNYHWEL